MPTDAQGGSAAAPSRPSAVVSSLAGLIDHPGAAQVRFAAPYFVDPEKNVFSF